MPQTAIPTAAGETAGSGRAPHYLLAYLEEGRVRVYASGKPGLWVGRQLCPYAEHAYAALFPARGQAYFDYACPLSGSVEPLQLRFDAHFVRSGKLPSDP